MAKTYYIGDTWVETVNFTVGGTPTDPTTFTATVYKPDGTTASPTVAHPTTGTYVVSTDLTAEGDWYMHAAGTGTAKGAKDAAATVRGIDAPGAKLVAEALVTVADMRFFLDRTGMTADLDELHWLEDLVNAYSLACAEFCNRQFTPERTPAAGRRALKTDPLAVGISKKFRYDGHGYLDFSPYEPRAVTSIVFGTDLPTSSQTTLFAGDTTREAEYRLEPPQQSKEGTWFWAVLPSYGHSGGGWYGWSGWPNAPSSGVVPSYLGGLQVTVTGDWGVADGMVPPSVLHACKIAIADAFRNPEDYAQRAASGMDITEQAPPQVGPLPPAARALLLPHKRP